MIKSRFSKYNPKDLLVKIVFDLDYDNFRNINFIIENITEDYTCKESLYLELRDICLEIAKRHDIVFLEIGTDGDHVHFLIQSIPGYRPSDLVRIIKSITAREIFRRMPRVKQQLWGGAFWSEGYFMATVGQHSTEAVIREYVRNQGTEKAYKRLHHQQLVLF